VAPFSNPQSRPLYSLQQIVACVLSRILNLFWFYKIVRMLVRHRAQRRASAADKAKKGN
jgi:hypothetical protein